mmetsp:Transcript_27512/g.26328  ORF Transcript_27512/g.26328 Transcript_27512/m.26328 type:complete len:185 (+) Transcript_27512:252-806(+)
MSERPVSTRSIHSRTKSGIGSADPIQWPLNGSYDGSSVSSGAPSRSATANRSTTASRSATANRTSSGTAAVNRTSSVRFSEDDRADSDGQTDIVIKPRDTNRTTSSGQTKSAFTANKTSIASKENRLDAIKDLNRMRERLYAHGSDRSNDSTNNRRIVRQCSNCLILYKSFHLCQSTNSMNEHK